MKHLLDLTFTSSDGIVKKENDGSVSLIAVNSPIGASSSHQNGSFFFHAEDAIVFEEYIVIEYACFGIKRPTDAIKPAFLSAKCADRCEPLFIYDDLTIDRQKHLVIAKAPKGCFAEIQLSIRIDKIREAYFTFSAFYTCHRSELPFACDKGKAVAPRPYIPIDLSEKYNLEFNFDAYESIVDAGRFFDTSSVYLYGVPFSVKPWGQNLIAPPPPPAENEEEIINFGAKTKRRYCRPVSRDSETLIPIGQKACEIYFILTLTGKRYIRCLCGSNSTILGQSFIDINEPLKAVDVEAFMVEVVYSDGRHDTHLPFNLGTNRHGISGDINVYGVPCDGEVDCLIIHNRLLDTDVNVAAVTVNGTGERLYPSMTIPEKERKIARVIGTSKKLTFDNSVLTAQNGAFSMQLDLSKGLHLVALSNDFTPGMRVKPDAILKTRSANGEINDLFEVTDVALLPNFAKITCNLDGTVLQVTADISGENCVKWDLSIINTTDRVFQKGILFPCISGIDFGSFEDNWYFVPKYQNLNSNETFYMYEESAPSFPMQFLDVYSPKMQGGISLTTQERELVTRKYSLAKDDYGIDFYVEYPVIYGDIAPGASFQTSPCLLTFHDRDWKQSFKIYKEWLDSWYKPYKCQNKQWYKECFWLLAEITDFFETEDFCAFPCWQDPETKEFKFRKILEEQKGITGVYPDILHMWSWCNTWRNGQYGQRWGNFGKEDYDTYGGVEAFRAALHDIRDNLGVQISLYMHPTLLTDSYKHAGKFYQTSMVKSQSGEKISIYGDSFRMCHAEEQWRQYALSMYPRLYKDLQIPLLYVDEFSLRIENRCYEDSHGHHVPSNLLKTDRDFITRLKDMMPEEVVLYGEYAAADVNARYIDCNISYYILDSIVDKIETAKRANDGDDRLSRVLMHTYRFAFPKIVQLILPMAMRNLSWHPQKFMFFNAEAIYDSFWDNEESRGTAFTVKAYKLKKQYADCFTSDHPEMLVETESPAICMNKFPGKNRTVYTVYNRAYSTYRGTAIRVPYAQGITFYDAWNEKPIVFDVVDGYAQLYLEIGAQEIGCILVE